MGKLSDWVVKFDGFESGLREKSMTKTEQLLLVRLARMLRAPNPIAAFTDHRGRRWEIWDLATARALVG